ncbi:hypothetical protein PENTCL1PPCAC_15898, partial [Pristionchus entomophagus]
DGAYADHFLGSNWTVYLRWRGPLQLLQFHFLRDHYRVDHYPIYFVLVQESYFDCRGAKGDELPSYSADLFDSQCHQCGGIQTCSNSKRTDFPCGAHVVSRRNMVRFDHLWSPRHLPIGCLHHLRLLLLHDADAIRLHGLQETMYSSSAAQIREFNQQTNDGHTSNAYQDPNSPRPHPSHCHEWLHRSDSDGLWLSSPRDGGHDLHFSFSPSNSQPRSLPLVHATISRVCSVLNFP